MKKQVRTTNGPSIGIACTCRRCRSLICSFNNRIEPVSEAQARAAASSRCLCSAWANLRACRCSRDSRGMPVALELGPMANPLLASQASRTQPTASKAPAWPTRLLIGSVPRTPMLTTQWKANEKRCAACLSKFVGFSVAGSFCGWYPEGVRP